MTETTTERPAQPGELCTCGRQAITVFLTASHGEVGYCGIRNARRITPCVFCGEDETRDFERCPEYRIRPVASAGELTLAGLGQLVEPDCPGCNCCAESLCAQDSRCEMLAEDGAAVLVGDCPCAGKEATR